MKKYKIFNKTGLAICLTLGLVAGSACSPTDDGPSIDDHFLNYEIPQIRPSSDIPVGAIYWNLGSTGVDEKKYARLIGEYNQRRTVSTALSECASGAGTLFDGYQ